MRSATQRSDSRSMFLGEAGADAERLGEFGGIVDVDCRDGNDGMRCCWEEAEETK